MLGPDLFFSFVIFLTQTVGLLGQVISPSQGRYLHTGQHNRRIKAHTNIHVLSGIRTHDPSVRASDNSAVTLIDNLGIASPFTFPGKVRLSLCLAN
jgi:hypothetical protein